MANKNSVRKLPIKAIEQANELFKETVTIDFYENDKTYTVTLSPYFEPTRINKLIQQFGEQLTKISDSKIEFPDELIPTYLLFLTVVEFSDFPNTTSKDIKKQVSYFTQVINTHYFKEVSDMVLPEEFKKVWDKVLELLSANQKLENMINKVQDEIQNLDLQSPELKERIQGKKKQIPEA